MLFRVIVIIILVAWLIGLIVFLVWLSKYNKKKRKRYEEMMRQGQLQNQNAANKKPHDAPPDST